MPILRMTHRKNFLIRNTIIKKIVCTHFLQTKYFTILENPFSLKSLTNTSIYKTIGFSGTDSKFKTECKMFPFLLIKLPSALNFNLPGNRMKLNCPLYGGYEPCI